MLILFAVAAQGAGPTLAQRAAALRQGWLQASGGRLPEYEAARLTLVACSEALAQADRELRRWACETAQQSVDACEQRRSAWIDANDQFTVDALALKQSQRYAELIKSVIRICPDTVPGFLEGPLAALDEQSRRERRQRPGYLVCESYLRALLDAADRQQPDLVDRIAQELVFRCGDDHPDYRLHAIAALTRVGHDAQVVLGRLRGAAAKAPASAASQP